ncbi:u4 tri-snrnp-associated [Stagonosporopsis vannaccii]|nr:u4 tri-snrnp-associated [Stagonosporopsis vannaccii]
MSDNERPRDHHRDRDSRREARGGRDRDNERSNTGGERRNRSRSPRQDRGGRREGGRYRSRSPLRRDERDSDRGRGDRGRGDRNDRGRSDRGPLTGPRSGAGPRGPPLNVSRPPPKAIKPDPFDEEEPKDVVMKEERVRPEGMDDETWEMAQVMGFAGFKSTKNTKVPGNDKNFGVRKDKQMEARQYMNRNGGFNRPLSPSRG